MVEQAKRQIWRNGGRFYGYRINCEQVPMLGACTVRAIPANDSLLGRLEESEGQ